MKSVYMQGCAMAFMNQFKQALDNNYESPVSIYNTFFLYYGLPRVAQFLLRKIIGTFVSKRVEFSLQKFKTYYSDDIDKVLRAKVRFAKMFKKRWESLQIDACINPTFYHCAFRHSEQDELSFNADYFMLWNVVHYPAGVVPITLV